MQTEPRTKLRKQPLVLIVRDGWGRNPHPEQDAFNAVKLAATPCCDALIGRFPSTLIHTSGKEVGLPALTMGNSEVGHQNLGAGRVVDQESVRITKAIDDHSFFANPVLTGAIQRARKSGHCVHLFGIASDAGVHGRLAHLYGCLEMCKQMGHDRVALHLFTDGRDTGPFTGKNYISQIESRCAQIGVGKIASICGRYYAMDRDNRWERVKIAYDMLVGIGLDDPDTKAGYFDTAAAAMQDYYDHPHNDHQKGDEFIQPRMIGTDWPQTRICDGQTIIFTNYRGDRPRQLTRAFVMPRFHGHVQPSPETGEKGFDRGPNLNLTFLTMTSYDQTLDDLVEVIFPKPPKLLDIGGEFLAGLGVRQFRCAETEKFPHVTFFFNGYREQPLPGESRKMAQSPRVPTYDLQPEMSADDVCAAVLDRIGSEDCEPFIVANFANGDMVGHTGNLEAAVKAIETVDGCVGQIAEATLARGGALIVTADHGNAEQMFDPATGNPHTAHTLYDVECIVVDTDLPASLKLRSGGRLADVLPTALKMMGLDPPAAMTGQSLLGEI